MGASAASPEVTPCLVVEQLVRTGLVRPVRLRGSIERVQSHTQGCTGL